MDFIPAYAGQFLKPYETYRLAQSVLPSLLSPSIIVPPGAVRFPDVSFYQLLIDWAYFATKNKYVIIRAGQNIWVDSQFERNYTLAGQYGLTRGIYWFYDGRIKPSIQAAILADLLKGREPEMEVFVDWERNYNGGYEGLPYVVEFMQRVETDLPQLKHQTGMYTGYYWFSDHTRPTANAAQFTYLKSCPLWLAWFADAAYVRIPAPWTTWTHWQFGTPAEDHGQQTIEIDMNRGNGDDSAYAIRYGGEDPQPPPTGGTMKGLMKKYTVNVRNSAGVIVTALFEGDAVYGEVYTDNRERIRFSKIYRAGGIIENLGQVCNAVTNDARTPPLYYMTLTNEPEPGTPPPPAGDSVFITHTFNDSLLIDGKEYTADFTVENVEYTPRP